MALQQNAGGLVTMLVNQLLQRRIGFLLLGIDQVVCVQVMVIEIAAEAGALRVLAGTLWRRRIKNKLG